MPDNNEKQNEKPKNAHGPGGGNPGRQLSFWFILLILVPATIFVLFNQGESKTDVLTVSQFENALVQKRVFSVIVEEQASATVQAVTGKYWPEGSDVKDDTSLKPYKTKIIYNEIMDRAIRENCPIRLVKTANRFWTGLFFTVLPLVIVGLFFYFFIVRQMRSTNNSAFLFGKSRARRMQASEDKVTLKDVAGISEAKEEMLEIVDYLKDPGRFQRLGGKIPRGVLMVGPPGTGKTLLAKAIAGEADVPFFSISGSDFVELFVGVGASRVRDMFAEGKKNAPCLIFIDEIDAVGRSRFSGIGGGHDEREQTLNALLVEMDGFEPNSGCIVIAATNRPDVLDKALLRPGRFDRQIVIDLPDLEGRFEILKIHAGNVKMNPDVDLHSIARGTPGFSGADLANLINEAAIIATRANKEDVGLAELEEARDKVCWGKERRSRKMTPAQRRLTAYHEAGHTLVNIFTEHSDPLHKVTIIPRGMSLGSTTFLPEVDRYGITENEARDMMTMGMGGRCAEKLVFNELTSGASMDIRQATDIARKMVCQWGMSPKMGPLNYGGNQEHIFLGRDITRNENFSPETGREIDIEIRNLVDEAENRAAAILTEHREMLELLANTLLEKETLVANQVYELLGIPPRKHAEEEPAEESKVTPTPEAEKTAAETVHEEQPAEGAESVAGN